MNKAGKISGEVINFVAYFFLATVGIVFFNNNRLKQSVKFVGNRYMLFI